MGKSDSDEGTEGSLVFGKTTAGSFLHAEILDSDEPYSPELDVLLNNRDIEIRTDPKRWLVLFVFCTTAWVNSILWITFAPISEVAQDFYSLDTPFWINCLFFSYSSFPPLPLFLFIFIYFCY